MGTKIIHFVGGEPTLRDDLELIIDYAKKNKIITAITTNGYIKPSMIDTLSKIDIVRVSLHGCLNEIILPKGYLNTVETLKKLRERNKKVLVTTTLSTETTEEDLEYIFNLARELKLKVNFYYVDVGISHINGIREHDLEKRKKELKKLIISQDEALKKIKYLYLQNRDIVIDQSNFIRMIESGGLSSYGCRAMDVAICLKANGAISMPCIEFPLKSVKGEIMSNYYSDMANSIRNKQGKFWFCEKCNMSCMYSATSLLSFKDIMGIIKNYFMQLVNL